LFQVFCYSNGKLINTESKIKWHLRYANHHSYEDFQVFLLFFSIKLPQTGNEKILILIDFEASVELLIRWVRLPD
jgi:hypothetical protein